MNGKARTLLAPGCRPQLREGVRLHHDRLSGRPVLLFPEGILQLSATAAAVLTLCDGHHSVREIVGILAATYDAPPGVLTSDVTECLLYLGARRLLHLRPEEAL